MTNLDPTLEKSPLILDTRHTNPIGRDTPPKRLPHHVIVIITITSKPRFFGGGDRDRSPVPRCRESSTRETRSLHFSIVSYHM